MNVDYLWIICQQVKTEGHILNLIDNWFSFCTPWQKG